MFMGEYNHTLDPKGRVIIPAKFRENLGDKFVITKGLDGCLYGYPYDKWEEVGRNFQETIRTNKEARQFSRFFFSSASDCDIDQAGQNPDPIESPRICRTFEGRGDSRKPRTYRDLG